jgi:hypothetical protein
MEEEESAHYSIEDFAASYNNETKIKATVLLSPLFFAPPLVRFYIIIIFLLVLEHEKPRVGNHSGPLVQDHFYLSLRKAHRTVTGNISPPTPPLPSPSPFPHH